jgi:uncharacterized protein DUF3467
MPQRRVADMADRTAKMTRSEGYHQIYANNVGINTSNWDILLEFGKIAEVSDTEIQVLNELGVYLGLGQAKALARTLSTQIEAYEKQIGEIPMEPKKK